MLTAQETELLQQLGRSSIWQALLQKRFDTQISVLKVNSNLEQLCRAQGAVAELDFFRASSKQG